MEIKKKEIKTYETVYVACDGTEFNSEEQCRLYDNSAICVLKAKMNKIAVKVTTEDTIFNCGNYDNTVYVCVPKNQAELDIIAQFMYANDHCAGAVDYIQDRIGKVLLITVNTYDNYASVMSLDSIIGNAVGDLYKLVPNEKAD